MSTEMGDAIPDCMNPQWSLEVSITNGRLRISAYSTVGGVTYGGKVFLDQEGARLLMEKVQMAHAYNSWQPYPELIF